MSSCTKSKLDELKEKCWQSIEGLGGKRALVMISG